MYLSAITLIAVIPLLPQAKIYTYFITEPQSFVNSASSLTLYPQDQKPLNYLREV